MKKTGILSIIALPLIVLSCGPSAEEKAAMQKRHDDSIAQVTRVKQQHDSDIVNLRAFQVQLDHKITDLQLDKVVRNAIQVSSTTEASGEQNEQLKKDSLEIERIQKSVDSLKTCIAKIKARLGNSN